MRPMKNSAYSIQQRCTKLVLHGPLRGTLNSALAHWLKPGQRVGLPELWRLMLRSLGKSRCRASPESWMEARLLLAMTSVSRQGNMAPNLRTSPQSCRLLSVMCSRRREGQGTAECVTASYSLRHRKSSSSLQGATYHIKMTLDSCAKLSPKSHMVLSTAEMFSPGALPVLSTEQG